MLGYYIHHRTEPASRRVPTGRLAGVLSNESRPCYRPACIDDFMDESTMKSNLHWSTPDDDDMWLLRPQSAA